MFWTELIRQRMFWDDDLPIGSTCVAQLIRSAREILGGDTEAELHRQFAFLTHQSTQQFLGPMLKMRYGSIDAAKLPTLEWLDQLGSLETFARSTRKTDGNGRSAGCVGRPIPAWYTRYLATSRWSDMKSRASELWQQLVMSDSVRCNFNRRHEHDEWHHSDYGRCGEADEFRYLVPLCSDCHHRLRVVGPSIPNEIPEGVKPWL